MGWAAHRIEEYREGQPATWLERRLLEHANPVHFVVALVASAGFFYGLWVRDWFWIATATVVALLGHVYSWTWKPGGKPSGHELRASGPPAANPR